VGDAPGVDGGVDSVATAVVAVHVPEADMKGKKAMGSVTCLSQTWRGADAAAAAASWAHCCFLARRQSMRRRHVARTQYNPHVV
jgi:hypothetical protein